MCQVDAGRKVQVHDVIVRLEEGGVGGKVDGGAGVGLGDVDAPRDRVEAVQPKRSPLTEPRSESAPCGPN